MMDPLQNDADADQSARDIVFDHDAILIGEDGAATPEQGVGMLVNKAVTAEGEQVTVINSSMVEDADRGIDWAVADLARAVERRQKAGALDRMKTVIMDALGLTTEAEEKDTDMADDKQLEALSTKVDDLATSVANMLKGVEALTDAQATIVANQKAADDAELAGLVEKITKANLLDADAAGELTLNAARNLAKRAEPGKAAGLHNGLAAPTGKDTGFKLPKGD